MLPLGRAKERPMDMTNETRDRIQALIQEHDVLLFMKGNREAPQCGFSATVVSVLDQLLPQYATFDVLSDGDVREGVKDFSSWPTIPQLYVKGEFIGGCDIIQESFATGELQTALGVASESAPPAEISITEAASEQLARASTEAPEGQALRLMVDARYRSKLLIGPILDSDMRAESTGVTLHLDPLSNARAQGAVLDVVRSRGGFAFQVKLPQAPNAVRAMSVKELAALRQSGDAFELFDVRTPEERETARIEGSTLLDQDAADRIASLPLDSTLVFHCHHGGRSQAAAEHFAAHGFTKVYNVVGGIDAWSQEIDPAVPRY
jgi:monothiol glutaredoxin